MKFIEHGRSIKNVVPCLPYHLKAASRSVCGAYQSKHSHERRISRLREASSDGHPSVNKEIARIGNLKLVGSQDNLNRCSRSIVGVGNRVCNSLIDCLGNGILRGVKERPEGAACTADP